MNVKGALKRTILVVGCIALPVIAWAQWSTSSNDIFNSNTGNVGIGTSSPGSKLDVNGWVATNGAFWAYGTNAALYAADRASTGYGAFYRSGGINALWDDTAGNVIAFDSTGKVGIGTSIPNRELHVYGAGQAGSSGLTDAGNKGGTLYLQDSGGAAYNGGSIILGASQGYFAGIKGLITDGTSNTLGDLDFQTRNSVSDTALTSRLYITHAGNIGLGTMSPSSRLDVVGDVTVSGNISAKYQDLAEWVPASSRILPGTVVILDPQISNSVMPSDGAYDTSVAGVVSATPGIVLGEAGENKVRVATTGRVKVRVDATSSPVHIGDLLVTSNRKGVAMKSEPMKIGGAMFHRPGTLIGKALEPLSEGQAEILVLLSLQ